MKHCNYKDYLLLAPGASTLGASGAGLLFSPGALTLGFSGLGLLFSPGALTVAPSFAPKEKFSLLSITVPPLTKTHHNWVTLFLPASLEEYMALSIRSYTSSKESSGSK